MTIELSRLVEALNPESTVLFFGAGSSVPSGAPSVDELIGSISKEYSIADNDYSLSEVSGISENRNSRKSLILLLRRKFARVRPTGGILNIHLYPWRSIYTTNYDNLIEQSYERAGRCLEVYSCDFDFTLHGSASDGKLFKLHGTIEKDISDGHHSRVILTESDYDATSNYREGIYSRFSSDLIGSHLVIIGYSLKDKHISDLIKKVADIGAKTGGAAKTTLLLFTKDEGRAALYESRGIEVCFGGIDEFFELLAKRNPEASHVPGAGEGLLGRVPHLRPCTVDVEHAATQEKNLVRMFNGYPATHADIVGGLTFERSVSGELVRALTSAETLCAVLLGPSGVGKTTAGRQSLQALRHKGYQCFEHKVDHAFDSSAWLALAEFSDKEGMNVALMVDDAGGQLYELNALVDGLSSRNIRTFKLLLTSERNLWARRVKSPLIFKRGKEFRLSRIRTEEVDRLLTLIEGSADVRALVEPAFGGFSRHERRRRLVDKCESEFFVCLKNIFATEKFDDIILREYARLDSSCQEVYRHVAAMESSGVRVHRQLVIRALGIKASAISAVLSDLTDVVSEYDVDPREGVYGWRCRHNVIAGIVRKYKYSDESQLVDLFEKVIDSISPTYDIEIRTIRELCNFDTGISSISDRDTQNRLLRKMMSVVPGERVPRHRLVRNLIDSGDFDKADTEIRIFESDFGKDGPVSRYKISLLLARANGAEGIMPEDR